MENINYRLLKSSILKRRFLSFIFQQLGDIYLRAVPILAKILFAAADFKCLLVLSSTMITALLTIAWIVAHLFTSRVLAFLK